MKLKEKISLEKVFEKEYKVKLVELESNKEAVITHFLHNSKNGVSQFFKKDAVKKHTSPNPKKPPHRTPHHDLHKRLNHSPLSKVPATTIIIIAIIAIMHKDNNKNTKFQSNLLHKNK